MRRGIATGLVGIAVSLLVLLAGARPAGAQSCLLALDGTAGAVRFDGLAPGDQRAWWTSVRNTSDEPIALEVQLRGVGLLAEALDVAVDRCDAPWSGLPDGTITCPEPHEQLLDLSTDPGAAPQDLDLGTLDPGEALHLRSTATMRVTAGDLYQGADGEVVTTYTATGDGGACTVPPVDPDDPADPPTDPTDADDPAPPGTTPEAPQEPDGGVEDPRAPARPGDPSLRRAAPDPRGPRGPLAFTGGHLGTLALGSVGTVMAGLALRGRGPGRDPREGPPARR